MGNVVATCLSIIGGGRAPSKIENTLMKVDYLVQMAENGRPNDREKLYVDAVKQIAMG